MIELDAVVPACVDAGKVYRLNPNDWLPPPNTHTHPEVASITHALIKKINRWGPCAGLREDHSKRNLFDVVHPYHTCAHADTLRLTSL